MRRDEYIDNAVAERGRKRRIKGAREGIRNRASRRFEDSVKEFFEG